eukprot:gnl/TRDRNA2_/TRDRNA2_153301_c0_seq1.p1 gnl/TRDRNA2_/TRDRNA2_153301_c0~~gnl/TRDRNA2_/TRDRNA2_153301_c0_seq1.p1  ORF type:complete len:553 (-),score=92.43 gnl/TRDRNA2_/TRDRNA2_153301_c0_seq1:10-1668(-)
MPRASRSRASKPQSFLPTALGLLVFVGLLFFFLFLFMHADALPEAAHGFHQYGRLVTQTLSPRAEPTPGPAAVELPRASVVVSAPPVQPAAVQVATPPPPVPAQLPLLARGNHPATAGGQVASQHPSVWWEAKAALPTPAPAPGVASWKLHVGKSCQNYANDDTTIRDLADSKEACMHNDACVAIECSTGSEEDCSLRAVANFVPFAEADCYERVDPEDLANPGLSAKINPEYNNLLKEYAFQQVTTQSGRQVNIICVRAPWERSPGAERLYKKHKDEILFLGISSFEDYPLDAMNPFSTRFPREKYREMFPGFLHMMHKPEEYFPPNIKTLLMSQSDFNLPEYPPRDYSIPRKYDFTLSGSDQDVANDCVGWSSFAKNWSFVKESLEVMCGEFQLKGVLVATKDKQGRKACSIPKSCKGLMLQTTYLDQQDYYNYLKQSKFAYLPQVHDASPRVSTQALAHDVPLLMNKNIKGGWKYVTEKTGEFFHDMSDFRDSLRKILKGADIPYHYEPRKWVHENYGNENSGKRLYEFVKDNFADRVKLPKNTKALLI